MEVLSVIIPVFNRDDSIDDCVSSVLNQEYKQFELICIDDGSSDCSAAILDEYVQKNGNVTVIHQVNAGVSRARNIGIAIARGDYITFVDSDDMILPEMYDVMIPFATMHQLDCVMCGHQYIHRLKKELVFGPFDDMEILGEKDIFNRTIKPMLGFGKLRADGLGNMWNKLYRREVISTNHLLLNEKRSIAEDWQFNLEFFRVCKSFGFVKQALYQYIRRGGETQILSYNPDWFRQALDDHDRQIRMFPTLDWNQPSRIKEYYMLPIAAAAYYRERLGKEKKKLTEKMDEVYELTAARLCVGGGTAA